MAVCLVAKVGLVVRVRRGADVRSLDAACTRATLIAGADSLPRARDEDAMAQLLSGAVGTQEDDTSLRKEKREQKGTNVDTRDYGKESRGRARADADDKRFR